MKTPAIFNRKNLGAGIEAFNPFRTMNNLQRQLERFADDLGLSTEFSPGEFSPVCDFEDSDTQYRLCFDIPGMKKENIKIELRDRNVLVVSGERKEEFEQKQGKGRYHSERHYGRFERSFALPSEVKADQIEAQYNDGVLEVIVPKSEVTKSKQIPIKIGVEKKQQH